MSRSRKGMTHNDIRKVVDNYYAETNQLRKLVGMKPAQAAEAILELEKVFPAVKSQFDAIVRSVAAGTPIADNRADEYRAYYRNAPDQYLERMERLAAETLSDDKVFALVNILLEQKPRGGESKKALDALKSQFEHGGAKLLQYEQLKKIGCYQKEVVHGLYSCHERRSEAYVDILTRIYTAGINLNNNKKARERLLSQLAYSIYSDSGYVEMVINPLKKLLDKNLLKQHIFDAMLPSCITKEVADILVKVNEEKRYAAINSPEFEAMLVGFESSIPNKELAATGTLDFFLELHRIGLLTPENRANIYSAYASVLHFSETLRENLLPRILQFQALNLVDSHNIGKIFNLFRHAIHGNFETIYAILDSLIQRFTPEEKDNNVKLPLAEQKKELNDILQFLMLEEVQSTNALVVNPLRIINNILHHLRCVGIAYNVLNLVKKSKDDLLALDRVIMAVASTPAILNQNFRAIFTNPRLVFNALQLIPKSLFTANNLRKLIAGEEGAQRVHAINELKNGGVNALKAVPFIRDFLGVATEAQKKAIHSAVVPHGVSLVDGDKGFNEDNIWSPWAGASREAKQEAFQRKQDAQSQQRQFEHLVAIVNEAIEITIVMPKKEQAMAEAAANFLVGNNLLLRPLVDVFKAYASPLSMTELAIEKHIAELKQDFAQLKNLIIETESVNASLDRLAAYNVAWQAVLDALPVINEVIDMVISPEQLVEKMKACTQQVEEGVVTAIDRVPGIMSKHANKQLEPAIEKIKTKIQALQVLIERQANEKKSAAEQKKINPQKTNGATGARTAATVTVADIPPAPPNTQVSVAAGAVVDEKDPFLHQPTRQRAVTIMPASASAKAAATMDNKSLAMINQFIHKLLRAEESKMVKNMQAELKGALNGDAVAKQHVLLKFYGRYMEDTQGFSAPKSITLFAAPAASQKDGIDHKVFQENMLAIFPDIKNAGELIEKAKAAVALDAKDAAAVDARPKV